jgi:predicted exporter
VSRLWRPTLALVALAAIGFFAVSQLTLDYRLDAFLPAPADAEQALVVDQVSAGPGGRLILASISGATLDERIEFSRQLADQWRRLPGVERVDNGEFELDARTEQLLMQARFLLVPDVEERLDPSALTRALDDRIAELSLAGRQAEALVRRDPLGLLSDLAQRLSAIEAPQTIDDIWLDQSGDRALLMVVSAWPAFAIAEQTELVAALESRFRSLPGAEAMELTLGGAPVIGVDSASRSRSNAIILSIFGSVFLLLILSWAWRSPALVLAGALPLAAGAVCGLLVTALAFDQVHGLTLAFGFTLLGVALDYPIHLIGHGAGRRLDLAARQVSSPLLLGAASTLIAYITIWASASPGLAQLGAFSAAGLAAAAVTTLLLPRLGLQAPSRHPARVRAWPCLPWLVLIFGVGGLTSLYFQGEARWSTDLTRLSPINTELLARDLDLRQAMHAGDVRHLLVINDPDLETVLREAEGTTELLTLAREQGLLQGWQAVTDLVPSQQQQRQRRAAWPDHTDMAERLQAADSRFSSGAFDPFLNDLEQLAELELLGPASWQGSLLELRVASLLDQTTTGWRTLILPSGLTDATALDTLLANGNSAARVVDLRTTSEAMVAAYRQDAGTSLALALLLIAGLLLLRLRRLVLTGRVLLPPLAAMACTAAILAHFDQGLTIVHLVGLLLAGGIGLDFAIFSTTLAADPRARARTNRAVTLCALSSGGVFLILGQSDIGLLRMLGLTVALGILLSWLFARLCQPPCRQI